MCNILENRVLKEYYINELFRGYVYGGSMGRKTPDEPEWNKWIHRNLSDNHCPECLKLDECWFLKEKTPKWPHHPHCHCILETIPYIDVSENCVANSAYSKFDPYLFNPEHKYPHSKEKLFNSWGYTVEDAKWLQAEVERQGLKKYINGDYSLGKLNKDGQRISIRIEIPRKNREDKVSFITGWMIYPNGSIRLTTPYGGK